MMNTQQAQRLARRVRASTTPEHVEQHNPLEATKDLCRILRLESFGQLHRFVFPRHRHCTVPQFDALADGYAEWRDHLRMPTA